MVPHREPAPYELVGRRAVDWLFGRPDGAHFFDGALIAVTDTFGPEVAIGAFAPLGLNAEATDFFLAVDGRVDRERDWQRLVAAHIVLTDGVGRRARSAGGGPRRRRIAGGRFHLVLEPDPPEPVLVGKATEAWLASP